MNLSLESYLERLEGEGWTLIESRESSADLARPIGRRTVARLRLEATAGGEVIQEREDVDVADYDRSIELNPSDAVAYYGRAVCLDVLGDRTRAIADYGKVIELDPWHEDAFYRRGVARAEIGDAEPALADLERALSLARDPDDRDEIRELIDDLRRPSSEPSAPIEYDSLGMPTSSSILPVPRQSVWPMVLLEFATLGIYGTYWYFSRRKSLNALSSDQRLPEALIVTVLLAAIVSVVLTVVSFASLDASTVESLESIFGLLDLGIGAAFLFFAFRVRGMLRDHLAERGITDAGISWFWTFLFNFLYLQYKINQIRSREHSLVSESSWGVPALIGGGVVAAVLAVLFVPALSSEGLSEADEHYNSGVEFSEAGLWEESIAEYDSALRLDPDLAEAYNNRGLAYGQLGEFDRAIADLDRAIELDPNRAESHNNRGLTYATIGQYEQAITDLDEAIDLAPDNWQPYFARGLVYADLGDSEQAITDLEKGLSLTDDPSVRTEIQGFIDGLGSPLQDSIGSDEDAITEVLEEMVAAFNDRDFEATAPLITANAFLDTEPIPEALQEALEFAEKIRGPYGQIKGFEIVSVMVFGDEAIATVSRIGDGGETVREVFALVKRDGRWLIDVIPWL